MTKADAFPAQRSAIATHIVKCFRAMVAYVCIGNSSRFDSLRQQNERTTNGQARIFRQIEQNAKLGIFFSD